MPGLRLYGSVFAVATALAVAGLILYYSDVAVPTYVIENIEHYSALVPKIAQYKHQLTNANGEFVPYMMCIVVVHLLAGPLSIMSQIILVAASATYRQAQADAFVAAYADEKYRDLLFDGALYMLLFSLAVTIWIPNTESFKPARLHVAAPLILKDLIAVAVVMICGNHLVLSFLTSGRLERMD